MSLYEYQQHVHGGVEASSSGPCGGGGVVPPPCLVDPRDAATAAPTPVPSPSSPPRHDAATDGTTAAATASADAALWAGGRSPYHTPHRTSGGATNVNGLLPSAGGGGSGASPLGTLSAASPYSALSPATTVAGGGLSPPTAFPSPSSSPLHRRGGYAREEEAVAANSGPAASARAMPMAMPMAMAMGGPPVIPKEASPHPFPHPGHAAGTATRSAVDGGGSYPLHKGSSNVNTKKKASSGSGNGSGSGVVLSADDLDIIRLLEAKTGHARHRHRPSAAAGGGGGEERTVLTIGSGREKEVVRQGRPILNASIYSSTSASSSSSRSGRRSSVFTDATHSYDSYTDTDGRGSDRSIDVVDRRTKRPADHPVIRIGNTVTAGAVQPPPQPYNDARTMMRSTPPMAAPYPTAAAADARQIGGEHRRDQHRCHAHPSSDSSSSYSSYYSSFNASSWTHPTSCSTCSSASSGSRCSYCCCCCGGDDEQQRRGVRGGGGGGGGLDEQQRRGVRGGGGGGGLDEQQRRGVRGGGGGGRRFGFDAGSNNCSCDSCPYHSIFDQSVFDGKNNKKQKGKGPHDDPLAAMHVSDVNTNADPSNHNDNANADPSNHNGNANAEPNKPQQHGARNMYSDGTYRHNDDDDDDGQHPPLPHHHQPPSGVATANVSAALSAFDELLGEAKVAERQQLIPDPYRLHGGGGGGNGVAGALPSYHHQPSAEVLPTLLWTNTSGVEGGAADAPQRLCRLISDSTMIEVSCLSGDGEGSFSGGGGGAAVNLMPRYKDLAADRVTLLTNPPQPRRGGGANRKGGDGEETLQQQSPSTPMQGGSNTLVETLVARLREEGLILSGGGGGPPAPPSEEVGTSVGDSLIAVNEQQQQQQELLEKAAEAQQRADTERAREEEEQQRQRAASEEAMGRLASQVASLEAERDTLQSAVHAMGAQLVELEDKFLDNISSAAEERAAHEASMAALRGECREASGAVAVARVTIDEVSARMGIAQSREQQLARYRRVMGMVAEEEPARRARIVRASAAAMAALLCDFYYFGVSRRGGGAVGLRHAGAGAAAVTVAGAKGRLMRGDAALMNPAAAAFVEEDHDDAPSLVAPPSLVSVPPPSASTPQTSAADSIMMGGDGKVGVAVDPPFVLGTAPPVTAAGAAGAAHPRTTNAVHGATPLTSTHAGGGVNGDGSDEGHLSAFEDSSDDEATLATIYGTAAGVGGGGDRYGARANNKTKATGSTAAGRAALGGFGAFAADAAKRGDSPVRAAEDGEGGHVVMGAAASDDSSDLHHHHQHQQLPSSTSSPCSSSSGGPLLRRDRRRATAAYTSAASLLQSPNHHRQQRRGDAAAAEGDEEALVTMGSTDATCAPLLATNPPFALGDSNHNTHVPPPMGTPPPPPRRGAGVDEHSVDMVNTPSAANTTSSSSGGSGSGAAPISTCSALKAQQNSFMAGGWRGTQHINGSTSRSVNFSSDISSSSMNVDDPYAGGGTTTATDGMGGSSSVGGAVASVARQMMAAMMIGGGGGEQCAAPFNTHGADADTPMPPSPSSSSDDDGDEHRHRPDNTDDGDDAASTYRPLAMLRRALRRKATYRDALAAQQHAHRRAMATVRQGLGAFVSMVTRDERGREERELLRTNQSIVVVAEAEQRSEIVMASSDAFGVILLMERSAVGALLQAEAVTRAAHYASKAQHRVGCLEAELEAVRRDLATAINGRSRLQALLLKTESGLVERPSANPLLTPITATINSTINMPIHERFAKAHQEAMRAVAMQRYPADAAAAAAAAAGGGASLFGQTAAAARDPTGTNEGSAAPSPYFRPL